MMIYFIFFKRAEKKEIKKNIERNFLRQVFPGLENVWRNTKRVEKKTHTHKTYK